MKMPWLSARKSPGGFASLIEFMKSKTIVCLFLAAFGCYVRANESGFAKVEVTELEFPTYGFSDPDPVARTDSPLYPYFRFDGSAATAVPKKWKAVILENDKIKVTMLPEIGGKVWGAEDKTTGRAFIY